MDSTSSTAVMSEIHPTNRPSKPTTPIYIAPAGNASNNSPSANSPLQKQGKVQPVSRSLSSSFVDDDVTMLRARSPRDSPRRKYFDSGDYELAKAGIVDAASVGLVHASPEKLAASRSGSAHHLQVPPCLSSRSLSLQPIGSLTATTSVASLSGIHQHKHSQQSPIKVSISAASLEDLSATALRFPASIDEDVEMVG